ncbi:hypothetical protein [Deinococcus apachensis]|uniref:hypothetical protein n=1 Tax=Deinococcus apachensis TaxID=309886 RepID=UPI000362B020|nr:hypothetical protein [Deinococcus apachensis]
MTSAASMVRWRVGDVLQAHGLTAYKLAGELHGKVNRNSVYAIARGDTERVDRATLAALLAALHALTGQRYTVGDLLEYSEAAPEAQEVDTAGLVSAGESELHAQLEKLEADTPPVELDAWAAAFGGKPA